MGRSGRALVAFDAMGKPVPRANVYVRRWGAINAATIYPDVDAATPMANPFQADEFGRARWHASGGLYREMTYLGDLENPTVLHDVPVGIGTAQWIDADLIPEPGHRYTYLTDTSPPPSAGQVRFDNADLSAAETAWVSKTTAGDLDIGPLLLVLDQGEKPDPSVLIVIGQGGTALWAIGTATDEGDYVALELHDYSGSGAILAGDVVLQREVTGQGTPGPQGPEGGFRINIAPFIGGRPRPGGLLISYVAVHAFTLPAGLVGSRAIAGVAATGEVVLDLERNGIAFGTLTFDGSATGVFEAEETTFEPGDVFAIPPPSERDDTLADLSITITGDVNP